MCHTFWWLLAGILSLNLPYTSSLSLVRDVVATLMSPLFLKSIKHAASQHLCTWCSPLPSFLRWLPGLSRHPFKPLLKAFPDHPVSNSTPPTLHLAYLVSPCNVTGSFSKLFTYSSPSSFDSLHHALGNCHEWLMIMMSRLLSIYYVPSGLPNAFHR